MQQYPFDVITSQVLYTPGNHEIPIGSRITCVGYGDESTSYSSDPVHSHLFKVDRELLYLKPETKIYNLDRIRLYTDPKNIWSFYRPSLDEKTNATLDQWRKESDIFHGVAEIPKEKEETIESLQAQIIENQKRQIEEYKSIIETYKELNENNNKIIANDKIRIDTLTKQTELTEKLLSLVATRFYSRGKASVYSTNQASTKYDFEEWYKDYNSRK